MKLEILKATRSWSNESEGENMAGCLAHNERVVAYFPTESAMENHARLLAAAPDLLGLLKDASQLERLTGENLAAFTRTFAALAANYVRKVEGGGE